MFGAFSTISIATLQTKPSLAPPPPPTNFSAIISASYATIYYTDSAGATSYTVTAIPTTNTHEIAVSRTFSSGSGYKLEVLSSQTTYTFSLVANNSGGSSTAVTWTASTKAATIQATPTITLTQINYIDISAQNPYSYVHLSSPKTMPNVIYSSFVNTGSTFGTKMTMLFYSNNGGASFTNIASRLKWKSNSSTTQDTGCSDITCSDDGKYVYVLTGSRYLNVSTDYGATFNFRTSTATNNTASIGLSTIPTGEVVMLTGQSDHITYGANVGTNIVHWSNNYNSTYKFKTTPTNSVSTAINPATNYVYYSSGSSGSSGSNNTNLVYYNAGSKENLLSFDFSAATVLSISFSTNVIWGIVSYNNLTFLLCAGTPRLYRSLNGTTFVAVPYFSTGGAGASVTINNQAWIIMEPYTGFVMVCSKDNPARFFYSKDKGESWAELTGSTIPTVPSSTGGVYGSCVLQDSDVVVTLAVTSATTVAPYYKRITFYKLRFPVDITNPIITTSARTLLSNKSNKSYNITLYINKLYVGISNFVSLYSISGDLITNTIISDSSTIWNILLWNGYIYVCSNTSSIKQYYIGNNSLANANFISLGTSIPYKMVFDASYVYLSVTTGTTGRLVRMPSTGGTYVAATHNIINNINSPYGVAVYEQYVYVGYSGYVARYNKSTSVSNLSFITTSGAYTATELKVYGEYLFVLTLTKINLYNLDGTWIQLFINSPTIIDSFEINDNRMYCCDINSSNTQYYNSLYKLTYNVYEFKRLTTVANPYYVYSDGNYAWITDNVNNSITRVQVSNSGYTNTISVGTNPVFVIQANSLYWVANNGSNSISVITPAANATISVTDTLSVTNQPRWLASDTTSVWVAYSDVSNNLFQINVSNTTTTSTYTLANSVYGIISDGTYIWATVPYNNSVDVYQISSLTTSSTNNPYKTITVGTSPTAIAYNSLYVYVTNNGSNTISRITQSTITGTPTVTAIAVGSAPISIYASDTYCWVLYSSNKVAQINVSDSTTVTNILLSNIINSYSIYSDGLYTWVTNSSDTLGGSPTISQLLI
jgi:hypothetical protein